MAWRYDLYSFWESADYGIFFTLNFPEKPTGYLEGCCLSGEWTITKIKMVCMLGFRKEDPALVIPPALDHIAATAVSPTNPYTYHLTQRAVRDIIEWAEREGVQPKAQGKKQLEAAPLSIEAGS